MNLFFVELTVSDWAASLAWYRDVLGLREVMSVPHDRFALLHAGEGRFALKEGTPAPGTVLPTFEVADLDEELRRLAGHGVTPDGVVTESDEGYRRARLRDPDGYALCLFAWRAAKS